MIDLNDDTASCSWKHLLEAATENAVTDFEIEFCDSLREKLARFGDSARLTDAPPAHDACAARTGAVFPAFQPLALYGRGPAAARSG